MVSFFYECTQCQRQYKQEEVVYLCPSCAKNYSPHAPLCGVLKVVFDFAEIRKKFTWQNPDWSLFSAVAPQYYPDFPVGNTPFFPVKRLGKILHLPNLWIKNDGLNPSGSLKDRASFLMVAEANRLGEDTLVTASTGNAASALSAVCAAAGKKALIFVPATAPKAKLVQMIVAGAKLIPIQGTYDDAFSLSLEYTKKNKGHNRNTAYQPLTIEGKKTVALEILQQNHGKVPDLILIPVGDGVIIAGVYKAFWDLKMAGIVEKMPKLVCVQAEKSNAIHHYITTGQYKNADNPATIADSISVSIPSNAPMARQAVLETQGFSLLVSDAEIVESQALLAQTTGIFAEPTAASVVAGAKKISQNNLCTENSQIVLLITGHGLKDIATPLSYISIPMPIEPKLENVEEALKAIL